MHKHTHIHAHTHANAQISINNLVKSWYGTVLAQNVTIISKLIVWLSFIKHVNIKMSYWTYNFTVKRITRSLNNFVK